MKDVLRFVKRQMDIAQVNLEQRYFLHLPSSTRNTIVLSSMGRSGSTWIASLLNYSNTYREIFEPFLPVRVPEANAFEYLQYISPDSDNDIFYRAAKNILEGRLARQVWLDSGNRKIFSHRRLIKDIRTNLMLGWFKERFPEMKIILLIRNPFSVVQSYMDLGWGVEPCGTRKEIDILLGQNELLNDYPLIQQNAGKTHLNDYFESLFFFWCVFNYVPLQQMKKYSFGLTFYENYLIDPQKEIEKLYDYANQPLNTEVFTTLKRPSRTSYQKNDFSIDTIRFTPAQMERGLEILRLFYMDHLYDTNLHPKQSV